MVGEVFAKCEQNKLCSITPFKKQFYVHFLSVFYVLLFEVILDILDIDRL